MQDGASIPSRGPIESGTTSAVRPTQRRCRDSAVVPRHELICGLDSCMMAAEMAEMNHGGAKGDAHQGTASPIGWRA